MDRWNGILRVKLNPNCNNYFSVAASLCFSPSSKTLIVPSANAIFFTGDRVEGTGNPVIERLSNKQNIADILVSKYQNLGVSVNAWVVEASTFNGPFAVYKEFIPSVNSWGEPKCYKPDGFPASSTTVLLLSSCLEEVKKVLTGGQQETPQTRVSTSSFREPRTIIFGFSKGGTILNQLITEFAHLKCDPLSVSQVTREGVGGNYSDIQEEYQIISGSEERLINSITEIHYVDVGLNSAGAYLTDNSVIENIAEKVRNRALGIRFALHGTPRQWCDSRRPWIANEKDKLLQLLEGVAQKTAGIIQVSERFYLANMLPNLQMHFEIIEILDIS
ncbi:hypothetical protein AQUCO_06700005v1 [Aquilegia coerulea]|uniref:DUF676 domain-containing protein n=1 Tax=Aquilegia coerulea TaxID=218851 RepID=A0A2G5CBM7_AQUCA|nr:hypothetical protein AQUCO_06700005v1 [Aquilegia coerulea]